MDWLFNQSIPILGVLLLVAAAWHGGRAYEKETSAQAYRDSAEQGFREYQRVAAFPQDEQSFALLDRLIAVSTGVDDLLDRINGLGGVGALARENLLPLLEPRKNETLPPSPPQ